MADPHVPRRRNWILIGLVAIGLPILLYLGVMLAIGLGLQSGY
jgi:hypothetical protein